MKLAMIIVSIFATLRFAQAKPTPIVPITAASPTCSSGPLTIVKVQMVREDGTIQTADGKILSSDYSEVIQKGPENALEKTFFCGVYSRRNIRMMMDALAAKFDLGARIGDIDLNPYSVFASQEYENALLTLNVSNIATINRMVKIKKPASD